MSLIAKLGHHFSYGSFKNVFSPIIASRSLEAIGASRYYAQTAILEDDDKVVEIDQILLPADYDPATFDPTDNRGPPTERVWRLVDEMSGLTLSEANELSSIMMEKFCFQMMKRLTMKERLELMSRIQSAKPAAGAAAKEEKKAEKTTFELKMEAYETASKLKIIKEIRTFMTLGLKEAKDLVEKTPAVLKKGVTKEEGEQIIEKMKALGATVVLV